MPRLFVALALILAGLDAPGLAVADSSGHIGTPPRSATPGPTAEQEYNRGLRARAAKDWTAAVAAFKKATELRGNFPEAWNELGYALRNQGRYDESIKAYDEALRLRPRYPEALEYLGEAYVKMGRVADARKILDQLKPLDPPRAKELAEVIEKGK